MNREKKYVILMYLFMPGLSLLLLPLFSSPAMAARVEAEVNVTKPSKSDSDSKSSIL
jgi:hypothetical protein